MFGRFLAWVRDHVWLTIGIVVGVFILWRVYTSSGSAATTTTQASGYGQVDPTVVQAGLALQGAQIQAQVQSHAADVALQAQLDTNASNVALAEIARQLQQYQTGQATIVAQAQIDATKDMTNTANTLQASIAAQNIALQGQIAAMQQQTQQALISQQTQIAQINANRDVAVTKANKKLCMITTACCEVLGKPDDCFELTQLRRLRDEYVAKLPDGAEQIKAYYAIAPRIIAGINAQEHARHLWVQIWQHYLFPAARATQSENPVGAMHIYRMMIDDLRKYIGPTPDSDPTPKP